MTTHHSTELLRPAEAPGVWCGVWNPGCRTPSALSVRLTAVPLGGVCGWNPLLRSAVDFDALDGEV